MSELSVVIWRPAQSDPDPETETVESPSTGSDSKAPVVCSKWGEPVRHGTYEEWPVVCVNCTVKEAAATEAEGNQPEQTLCACLKPTRPGTHSPEHCDVLTITRYLDVRSTIGGCP